MKKLIRFKISLFLLFSMSCYHSQINLDFDEIECEISINKKAFIKYVKVFKQENGRYNEIGTISLKIENIPKKKLSLCKMNNHYNYSFNLIFEANNYYLFKISHFDTNAEIFLIADENGRLLNR